MVYLTCNGQANLSLYLNLEKNKKHMRNVTGTWENWDVDWHQVPVEAKRTHTILLH